MGIAEEILADGQIISAADSGTLVPSVNAAVQKFLDWPYKIGTGQVIGKDGEKSSVFGSVVYVDSPGTDPSEISADNAAAVIDIVPTLTIETLRDAHARVRAAKRLKKSPAPKLDSPSTTTTLGIVFAQRTTLPMDKLADELERLNTETPGEEWPDMVAISSTALFQNAVQFPGEPISGDYLPPAAGALSNYVPAIYVVIVLRPSVEQTFNKLAALLVAHLAIFSPGTRLPNFTDIQKDVPKSAVVVSGFQYSLNGSLRPVPSKRPRNPC